MITLLKYLKQINFIEAYPDNYENILVTLCQKIVPLIGLCNTETVQTPIESLTIMASKDRKCAEKMGALVL